MTLLKLKFPTFFLLQGFDLMGVCSVVPGGRYSIFADLTSLPKLYLLHEYKEHYIKALLLYPSDLKIQTP